MSGSSASRTASRWTAWACSGASPTSTAAPPRCCASCPSCSTSSGTARSTPARSSTSRCRSTRPPTATARWTSARRSRSSCGHEPLLRLDRASRDPPQTKVLMQVTRSSIDTQKGLADWFSGDVYIDAVAAPEATSTFAAASVHFTPGARTAWHTHPHGQTIFITEGAGLCQREGGPIEEIRPGDRVFFEPGENHWHGAAPHRFMVHLAMQQNDESGSPVTWGEHVSDEHYRGERP